MNGRAPRRGSAYVLALMSALVVVLIGLSVLMARRIDGRLVELEQDWHEASVLAQSVVDLTTRRITTDLWWRDMYKDYEAAYSPEEPLGRGMVSFRLDDATDNDLGDDPADPVRIHGRARVGHASRAFSVLAFPNGPPLDVLRTAIHASGSLEVREALDVRYGPASTNAEVDVGNGLVLGDVEGATIVGSANVTGSVSVPVPAKTMPSLALWNMYKGMATEIKYNDLGAALEDCVLSPGINPVEPADTSFDGLYYIKVPNWSSLTIRRCRIEGTLLVELQQDSNLMLGDGLVWAPARPDFPALIVYARQPGTAIGIVCAGELDEFLSSVNFNPPETPYYGESDQDLSDTYPSSLRGVFHVMRHPHAMLDKTTVTATRRITGCLVIDGEVLAEGGCILAADPMLLSNPPLGYTTATDPSNLLLNGDMEAGLAAWTPVGGAQLQSGGGGHSGAAQIEVKSRPSAAAGIRQDVTAHLVNGVAYTTDVWLKMNDEIEDVRIALEIGSTGEGTQHFTAIVLDVQKSWTRAVVVHQPTWTGSLNYGRLVVRTTSTDQTFKIDDAFLTPQLAGLAPPQLTLVPGTWRAESAADP